MIEIGKTLVSLDVIEKKFCCNIDSCKGHCCVDGVSGAPLENDEAELLEKIYPTFRSFLSEESNKVIEKNGYWYTDSDGDKVTTLINGKECVYVFFENGIAKCAIEKAFRLGLISFRKPISCHLYPIRIDKYEKFEAVNYHKWEHCDVARKKETHNGMPLYVFLKEPLSLKYGEEWYAELCVAAEEYSKIKTGK